MLIVKDIFYLSFYFVMWDDSKWTTVQVFDVGEEAPDKVLRRIYLNLETLKRNGDELAGRIEERLRIIVSSVTVDTFWCLCFLIEGL